MKTLALLIAITSTAYADKAVEQLLDSQVGAWNRKDLEGYMAGYWKSPKLTFYSGGTVTAGWQ